MKNKKWTKVAIVTGATSGFGRIFVQLIDENCHKSVDEIWVVGRREELLDEVANKTAKDVRLFPMDLNDPESIKSIEDSLKADKIAIKMLVNAAGFGINTSFEDNSKEEVHDMINLNCTALADLTKICLPYMAYNSRIVNFASVASFMPQPNFSVYSATKAFVLSFSRSLNMELKDKGVCVTAVCPGPSGTEFFDKAVKDGKYPKYKKYFWANPEAVTRKAFKDSLAKKEVSVYSFSMNAMRFLVKVIPHRVLLKVAHFLNG